jgi:dUTPase
MYNNVNLSGDNIVIRNGEQICQMFIAKHEKVKWFIVNILADTERVKVGLHIQVKVNYEI